jgi:hypothetical protein
MATTVTKSIGTSSRDYSTGQAWEDAIPADLTRNRTGTTQVGSTSLTIVLDSGASATDDFYNGLVVWCDARSSEKRLITDYVGATRTATIGALNGSNATWDNIPGTEAFTVDQVTWNGEMYNDAEFTATTNISAHTTSSSAKIILTAAAGQSFQDHANVRTNALTDNQSLGVKIRRTTGYTNCVQVSGVVVNYTISRLMMQTTNVNSVPFNGTTLCHNAIIKDCLMRTNNSATSTGTFGDFSGDSAKIINCIVLQTHATGAVMSMRTGVVYNSTFIRSSDLTPAGNGMLCKNYGVAFMFSCAIFGATTPAATAGVGAWQSGSSHNATDAASGLPGSNNQHSVSYSQTTPFVDADKDSFDGRAIAGTSLAGNGFLDATNAPQDISGFTRPSSPTIGAWQLAGLSIPPGLLALQHRPVVHTRRRWL